MKRLLVYIAIFYIFSLAHLMAQGEKTLVKGMYIHQGGDVAVFGNLQNVDSILYNDGHLTMIGDSLRNEAPIQGTGALEMLGDQDQHITHKGIIIVDSLILNNRLDISFNNNIIIDKHSAFINGILYDNYDAMVSPDSLPSVTYTKNADFDTLLVRDESHIEGLVRKQGRTRFIFPIGDANFYRPAIADNISADTTISAHYYYEWIDYPEEEFQVGVELFRDEYWYVSGSEKAYDLTLTYDPMTSTFDTDEDSIRIVSYDELRDTRYRLIDAEPASVMSQLSYLADNTMMDSTYVWYGFGKIDPYQTKTIDLFIPQILSPNGDGSNDKFVIRGLANYPDNKLLVFNRYGDVLYEKDRYDNTWDGTANKPVLGSSGNYLLPTGTYFVFFYNKGELVYKDFVQLLRTD